MPPDKLRFRAVLIHAPDLLRDVSVQAERLYYRMATGSHSTRIGVIARPFDLTAETRLKKTEIESALMELQGVGLVALSASNAVYLVGHCAAVCPKMPTNRAAWEEEARKLLHGNRADLLTQVLEEIGSSQGTEGGSEDGNDPGTGGSKKKERKEEGKKKDTAADADPEQHEPWRKIIDLWAELMPSKTQPRKDAKGQYGALITKQCKARWAQFPDESFWRELLIGLSADDWTMGRIQSEGRKPFDLTLDYLTGAQNIDKVQGWAQRNRKHDQPAQLSLVASTQYTPDNPPPGMTWFAKRGEFMPTVRASDGFVLTPEGYAPPRTPKDKP